MGKTFGNFKQFGKAGSIGSIGAVGGLKPLPSVEKSKLERQYDGLSKYAPGYAIAAYLRGEELFNVGGKGGWSSWLYEGTYDLASTFALVPPLKFIVMAFPSESSNIRVNFTAITKQVGGGLVFELGKVLREVDPVSKDIYYKCKIENPGMLSGTGLELDYLRNWRMGTLVDDTGRMYSEYWSYVVDKVDVANAEIYLRERSVQWHNQSRVIVNPSSEQYPIIPKKGDRISGTVRYSCTCPHFCGKDFAAIFSSSESRRVPVTQSKTVFSDTGLSSLTRPENPEGQVLQDGLSRVTSGLYTKDVYRQGEPGTHTDFVEKDFKYVSFDDLVPCKHIYAALLATGNKFVPPTDYGSQTGETMQEIREKIRSETDSLILQRKNWNYERVRPDMKNLTSPFTSGGNSSIREVLADVIGLALVGKTVDFSRMIINPEPILTTRAAYENSIYDPDFPADWLPPADQPDPPIPPILAPTRPPSGNDFASEILRQLRNAPE